MIIKSKSRKDKSYSQLMDYITEFGRAEEGYYYGHNTFSNDPEKVLQEIFENAKLIKDRKNGNYLYHEFLSITKEDGISDTERKDKLREIMMYYIERRAQNGMAFCAMHDDHEHHLHYHIMICANEIGSSKKLRMRDSEFNKLKLETEQMVLRDYPELKQELTMGKRLLNADIEKSVISDKEVQIKKRGKKTKIENIADIVSLSIGQSASIDELNTNLSHYGFELYQRGNTYGVKDVETGTAYRFKRLGVDESFAQKFGVSEANKSKRSGARKQKPLDEKAQKIKIIIEQILREETTKEGFIQKLTNVGLRFYDRGEVSKGVVDIADQKAYRFGRLGLMEKVNNLSDETHTEQSTESGSSKSQDQVRQGESRSKQDDEITAKDHLREWVFGDFSKRDDIRKQQEAERDYQDILKALQGEGVELSASDLMKELIAGNFEARDRKARIEKAVKTIRERQSLKVKETIEKRIKKLKEVSEARKHESKHSDKQ